MGYKINNLFPPHIFWCISVYLDLYIAYSNDCVYENIRDIIKEE